MALAFKLEEGKFGQLTYMRLYSGTLRKGEFIVNTVSSKRIKVLLLLHSCPACRARYQPTLHTQSGRSMFEKHCAPVKSRFRRMEELGQPCIQTIISNIMSGPVAVASRALHLGAQRS